MSLIQPPAPDRRPSMELATNNPFRARLSAAPQSPASDSDRFSFISTTGPRERPKSRNPFLDVFDDDDQPDSFGAEPARNPHRANSFDATSTSRPQLTGSAAELFENLTISSDHSRQPSGNMSQVDQPTRQPPRPPPGARRPPPPGGLNGRRESRDDGEEPRPLISVSTWGSKERPGAGPQAGRRPPGPPGSRPPPNGERPRGDPRRRPRRNSDSSVVEAHEAESRDRSRRERSSRDPKTSRDKDGKKREGGSRKKSSALDVIDKLDVTGIYGQGLFHHDGPFDACNPHRNKSSRRLAPVQAFPADSANNSMAFGPAAEKADHSLVFGNREPEAFNDYTTAAKTRPMAGRATSFDPKAAIETLHGDESLGLGTSTFLDGAPASKIAMQRHNADEDRPRTSSEGMSGGGLQRKKSLAQKFRSISVNKNGAPGEQPISSRRRAPPIPAGQRSPSDGRSPATPTDKNDNNPFFNDEYDDRKGETISVSRDRAPSSPRKPHPGISRVNTDDVGGNGLLKRVRSLSKSKRKE